MTSANRSYNARIAAGDDASAVLPSEPEPLHDTHRQGSSTPLHQLAGEELVHAPIVGLLTRGQAKHQMRGPHAFVQLDLVQERQ